MVGSSTHLEILPSAPERFRSTVRMPPRCAASCWREKLWWIIGREPEFDCRRTFTTARKSATSHWRRLRRSSRHGLGKSTRFQLFTLELRGSDYQGFVCWKKPLVSTSADKREEL